MGRFTYQASQKRLQAKTACTFPQGLIDCAERSNHRLVFDHNEPAGILRQQRRQVVGKILSFNIQHSETVYHGRAVQYQNTLGALYGSRCFSPCRSATNAARRAHSVASWTLGW